MQRPRGVNRPRIPIQFEYKAPGTIRKHGATSARTVPHLLGAGGGKRPFPLLYSILPAAKVEAAGVALHRTLLIHG